MAVDNKQIATDVLELVGGAENVTVATNCMTRLRLTLKDNSKADVEKIKKVKGCSGLPVRRQPAPGHHRPERAQGTRRVRRHFRRQAG